ncbi:MAG TPA: 50S ribosomal protein L18 [Patescibacteria group bacterium]|nr:50S ribosomal protein L18 [Patescibacteria group bacterium]
MKLSRNKLRLHRKRRIRARVFGVAKKPRLCIFKSLLSLSVQIVDDSVGKTLIFGDTRKMKIKNDISGAGELGKKIAKLAADKKIVEVVFDRGGYKYHGKVKALADGAREGGLKF